MMELYFNPTTPEITSNVSLWVDDMMGVIGSSSYQGLFTPSIQCCNQDVAKFKNDTGAQ